MFRLRWPIKSRSRLQLRSHARVWRDTFLSKPLNLVNPLAREIVLDVGSVVHPIPPHRCLITWLQGWNKFEKLEIWWLRKNGLKRSSASIVVYCKEYLMTRCCKGLLSPTPLVDSRTIMVIDYPRVNTRGYNISSTLWYILFTLWHIFLSNPNDFWPSVV